MNDLELYEDLFKLNTEHENTMNQDNYIFRQIKLQKEINKIKKKAHGELLEDELQRLVSFEELLRSALMDEYISDEEGEAE